MRNFSKLSKTLLLLLLPWLLVSCTTLGPTAKDKEKAKVYLQLAADQYAQKEYTKSIESTLQALKYEPEFPAAYNHLGILYMDTKQYEKSRQYFKKALELQPDYPEVFNNMGVLLNREEKFSEAIPFFERALANEHYITPENAYTNMGFAYYRLGKLRKAKEYHQRSLDFTPQFCLANKNMGDIYAKEKNFSKAAEYFERAITTCPLFEESHYKLGLAMMKLGQRKIARAHFQKIIETHKTGPFVERSSEVLKYLQ